MKIIILNALPSSGKTTFATLKRKKTKVITFDGITYNKTDFENKILEELKKLTTSKMNTVIFDGLFLTKGIITFVIENINKILGEDTEISIIHWKEDREKCLHNSKNRNMFENKPVDNSIKTLPFDKLTKSSFKKYENVSFTSKKVVVYDIPEYKKIELAKVNNKLIKLANDLKLYPSDKGIIKSETWSLGGESWGYDSDEKYPVYAESPIETFTEFDEILEHINYNFSITEYNKIKSYCIEDDSEDAFDYYSNTKYGFYVCDLHKMKVILKDVMYDKEINKTIEKISIEDI